MSAGRCSRICSMSAAPTVPLPSWTSESLAGITGPGPATGGRPSAGPAGDEPERGPPRAPHRGAADVQPVVDRPNALLHVAFPGDHRDVVLGRPLGDGHDVQIGRAHV